MYRRLAFAVFLTAAVSASPRASVAAQQPINVQQMASLQYLVGTWHCAWKSGSHSGNEDQVFTPALNGAWLEEREIVTMGNEQVVTTLHYTGYDPSTKQYVHLGPDADGSYEIATSPDSDVWSSSDGTLIHKKVSDVMRTMTETAGSGADAASVSMTCTKAEP